METMPTKLSLKVARPEYQGILHNSLVQIIQIMEHASL